MHNEKQRIEELNEAKENTVDFWQAGSDTKENENEQQETLKPSSKFKKLLIISKQ